MEGKVENKGSRITEYPECEGTHKGDTWMELPWPSKVKSSLSLKLATTVSLFKQEEADLDVLANKFWPGFCMFMKAKDE